MDEKEYFFKLLTYSNGLEEKGRYLMKEDFKAYKKLLEFLVQIENTMHFLERDEYLRLIDDFLNDKINADDFSFSFMAIFEGINKKLNEMTKSFKEKSLESIQLSNLFAQNKSSKVGSILARLYGSCDNYNPNSELHMFEEAELRNLAKVLLLELQKN